MFCLSQISVFTGKNHSAQKDLVIGTVIQIKLDPVCDLLHGFFQDPVPVQNSKRLVCGIAVQDLLCTAKVSPRTDGPCCKNLHSPVRTVRMSVHDPCCNFYKLADMRYKKDSPHSHIHSHINGFSHIIAALNISFER